jgi:uncharacterized membrane protein
VDGLSRVGRILFGVAMVFFGLLYLFHAWGMAPAPGPPWTAETGFFAWLIGIGFVVAGLCILSKMGEWLAAALLGAVFLLRVLFVFVPRLFSHLHDPGPWTSGFEVLALIAVALVLAGGLESFDSMSWKGLVVAGRLLFAVTLVIFGIQHFMYAKFIAADIPAWIPGHLFWAYFVGVAFVVAAFSIATKIEGRAGATLLGLMFLLWVVVLHAPRVMAAMHDGNEWTSAIMALAMGGGAFVMVGALRRVDR